MLILPNSGPNRAQRRSMDKEIDRSLPREERIRIARERDRKIAVNTMQGYAAKDWQAACKKHTPKWAVWISYHIPPRKLVLTSMMVLRACPLVLTGGVLRWSLGRMRKTKKVPAWAKAIYAVGVVGASFALNTVGCLLCVLRFPLRWMVLDPVVRFQNFMVHFGVSFRLYEDEISRMARLEVRRFGKVMETFSYKL